MALVWSCVDVIPLLANLTSIFISIFNDKESENHDRSLIEI